MDSAVDDGSCEEVSVAALNSAIPAELNIFL